MALFINGKGHSSCIARKLVYPGKDSEPRLWRCAGMDKYGFSGVIDEIRISKGIRPPITLKRQASGTPASAAKLSRAGKNLLPDSSFELTGNGVHHDWSCISQQDDSEHYHGTYSIRCTAKRGVSSRIHYLTPGVPHTLSVYLKASRSAEVRTIIQQNTVDTDWAYIFGPWWKVGGEWKRYSFAFTPKPCFYDMSAVMFQFQDLPADQSVWIDGVQLEEGKTATAYKPALNMEVRIGCDKPARLFREDEKLQFVLHAFNGRATQPETYVLHAVDFFGRITWQHKITFQGPPENHIRREITIPNKKLGTFRLELYRADANDKDGLGMIEDQLIYSVMPIITTPTLGAHNFGPDLVSTELGRTVCKRLGIKNFASVYYTAWRFTQPGREEEDDTTPGRIAWQKKRYERRFGAPPEREGDFVWYDKFFEASQEHGFEVAYAQLSIHPPKWAVARKDKRNPWKHAAGEEFDLDDWVRYVKATVTHYGKWVKVWELQNEAYGDSPDNLVKIAKAGYAAIKSVMPEARVLVTSPYPLLHAWVDRFEELGWSEYNDILGSHAYEQCGGYVPEHVAGLRKWSRLGGKTVPVWNTEYSLSPNYSLTYYTHIMPARVRVLASGSKRFLGADPDESAERLTKLYVTQRAYGVERFFHHCVPGYFRSFFPLFTSISHSEPDTSQKPILVGQAISAYLLGEATPCGFIRTDSDLRAALFEKGRVPVAVVWSREYESRRQFTDALAEGTFRTYHEALKHHGAFRKQREIRIRDLRLNLPAREIQVLDMMGNPIALTDPVILPVSQRPVYVFGKGVSKDQLVQAVGSLGRQAEVSMGVATSDGKPAIIARLISRRDKMQDVTVEITQLSGGLEASSRKQHLRLKPKATADVVFPLSRMPASDSGAGGFRATVTVDGKTREMAKERLWVAHAVRTDKPPTIDAKADDWAHIKEGEIILSDGKQADARPQTWKGPADLSGTIRLAWDATNLYVLAEIVDPGGIRRKDAAPASQGRPMYGGDCIELFFDADVMGDLEKTLSNDDDYHLYLGASMEGKYPEGDVGHATLEFKGVSCASRPTRNGYVLEASVPFSNFAKHGLQGRKGQVIGFSCTICDKDEDEKGWGKLIWTQNMNLFRDTSLFGRLLLVEKPYRAVASAKRADRRWRPAAHYRFDEGKGLSVNDAGGSGFHGRAHDIEWSPNARQGHAVVLNARSHIQFKTFFTAKHRKLEFWVCPAATGAEDRQVFREESTAGWYYSGVIESSGVFRFRLTDYTGRYSEVKTGEPIAFPGKWVSIRVELDVPGSEATIHVNGRLSARRTMTLQEVASNLVIGSNVREVKGFQGLVDEFVIQTED